MNEFKNQPDHPESAAAVKTAKGRQTRARILDTALGLFRERGFEQTTMRAISGAAGVSLGNAYYYFGSKERLIQAFYGRTHDEHLAACAPILESERDLHKRLLGVMRAKLDTIAPYHRFAGVLFKSAADPRSPLNPFSLDSRAVRGEATALMARVVEGSDAKLSPRLRRELPELLWLYHMGVILFWIHDSSPGCARSYRLMERTVDLVVKLITLARVPLMRPLVRRALDLIADLRGNDAPPTAEENP